MSKLKAHMSGPLHPAEETRAKQVADEARAWLLRQELDDMDARAWQDFATWQMADPAHMEALETLEKLWGGLADKQAFADLEPLDHLSWRERVVLWRESLGETWSSFKSWLWIPVAATCALALVYLLPLETPVPTSVSYSTAAGQTREVALEDGSLVTLGGRSAIDVAFNGDMRLISLEAGEAYFDVANSAGTPFVVKSGEAEIQVLGTAFNVRRGGAATRVDVAEGRVKVSVGDGASAQEMQAGTTLSVKPGEELAMPQPVTSAIAEWREGRLDFYNASLFDVLADARRYFANDIIADDVAMADMRLTGSFKTDEIGVLIDTLTVALPVVANKRADGAIYLTVRQGG